MIVDDCLWVCFCILRPKTQAGRRLAGVELFVVVIELLIVVVEPFKALVDGLEDIAEINN